LEKINPYATKKNSTIKRRAGGVLKFCDLAKWHGAVASPKLKNAGKRINFRKSKLFV